MTMRYVKATFYPRDQVPTKRGEMSFAPDMDSPQTVRIGISGDRANRAEVRGDVEIEVYNIRLPAKLEGVGPGALIQWDDSDWDVIQPPFLRKTRTHSVRHLTSQMRRRPYASGGRD